MTVSTQPRPQCPRHQLHPSHMNAYSTLRTNIPQATYHAPRLHVPCTTIHHYPTCTNNCHHMQIKLCEAYFACVFLVYIFGSCFVSPHFSQEHIMRATQYLPDIVRLQQHLYDIFHHRLDRREAKHITIREFLQGRKSGRSIMLSSFSHTILGFALV